MKFGARWAIEHYTSVAVIIKWCYYAMSTVIELCMYVSLFYYNNLNLSLNSAEYCLCMCMTVTVWSNKGCERENSMEWEVSLCMHTQTTPSSL